MRLALFVAGAALMAGAAWLPADQAEDQFNFATGLLIRNEPRLAADEFQKLLAKAPQFAQADVALYRLGEALQKAGDAAGARQALERLIRDWPKSGRLTPGHYLLGQILAAADPRAAAAHFAAALAGEPAGPLAEPAAFGRAEALYQAGDWAAAAAAYAAVLAQHPDGKYAAQALYSRGWAEFMAGDFAAAVKSFDVFGQRFPAHELAAECRLKRADSLFKLKRWEEALQAYDNVKSDKAALAADALVGRAWCLHEQRKLEAAVQAFRAASQALGKEPRAAVCLFNAGNDAIAAGQFSVAAEVFAQVRTGWPAHELAKPSAYWQALAELRQGKSAEAIAGIEALRQAGPPADLAADVLMLLAEARTASGEPAAAAALYALVLKEHAASPLAGDAAAARVLALEKAGDVAGAEAAAVAFVAAYPQHAQRAVMSFLIGEYRYRQAKYAEALPALEAFLQASPQHELADDALFKSGWAAVNLKDAGRARAAFGLLVTNFPASPLAAEAAFMDGRTADAAGDAAAAARAFGLAVRLGGTNVPAQRAALELVRLDQRAKRFDAALRGAEAFLATHADAGPRLAFARLYQGEALLELGRPDEALQAYARVGAGDPAAAAAATNGSAWAQRKLGRHVEAAALFRSLSQGVSVEAAEAAFWAARSLEDAGKPAEALTIYDDLLQRPAGQAHADEAAYRRAACLWRAQGAPASETAYAGLLAARPQSAFVPAALYDLAWVLQEQKKLDASRSRFEELLTRFPKDELAPDACFRLGEMAYDRQAFTNAAASYEAALAAGVPFADKVLYKLGWAREKAGQPDQALTAFQRLAREFPQSELADEARYRQGRLLQSLGRAADAVAAFAAVGGAGAFAERAAFGRAEALRAAGRHQEALQAYDGVLKQWPQGDVRVQALLGRGHTLRALGANQDAIEAYAAVIQATDTLDAAQAVLGQGYAHLAMRAWEDAAKAFLKVDILYGYEELKPEALDMLGKTWEQAGDAAKAAKYRAERAQRYPGR
jgi:TolA-binding protein